MIVVYTYRHDFSGEFRIWNQSHYQVLGTVREEAWHGYMVLREEMFLGAG